MWVGLPSQRDTNASADSSYLNELYRSQAEKAGIVYVDIWDGFVDEEGKFSPQGPDHLGQTRRLRTRDALQKASGDLCSITGSCACYRLLGNLGAVSKEKAPLRAGLRIRGLTVQLQ